MNKDQTHLYGLLMNAADKLRAFQLYEIGSGHGHVTTLTNVDVLKALTAVWDAARKMEKEG